MTLSSPVTGSPRISDGVKVPSQFWEAVDVRPLGTTYEESKAELRGAEKLISESTCALDI